MAIFTSMLYARLISGKGGIVVEYLQRMARYNQWMNQKLYSKVQLLPAEEIAKDSGAFFGSIMGTLNHIYVADLFWLRRFAVSSYCNQALSGIARLDKPKNLRDILHKDINKLSEKRQQLDELILSFSNSLSAENLKETIKYRNMKAEKHEQQLGALLQHMFNHQTHHRGQATTLLFQAGIDPEVTDMLVMMKEEGA